VPNTITDVPAEAEARSRVLPALACRSLLSNVPTLLVRRGGVFTGAVTAAERGTPSKHQPTSCNYQNMTRIAAAGGNVSGSHPPWDPV
jgi:hypothetical protein